MTEKEKVVKTGASPDWFMRGALTKIGDTVDALTGRRWVPSSTLATSELIERMKRLLDSEAKEVEGKGRVVPHNIKLKMQWDKFSTDSETALESLKNELLAAAADHINDSLYYTYAPLSVDVKPDYFTEGVRLFVGFDKFAEDDREAEMNVTIAGVQLQPGDIPKEIAARFILPEYVFRYTLNGSPKEKRMDFPPGQRVSIGRTSSNDLFLDDSSVSKIHASLMVNADAELSVADTGSTNGTFINGQRIPYGKALVVKETDRLKFGTVEVTFEKVVNDVQAIAKPTGEAPVAIDGMEFRSRETTLDPAPLAGEKTASMDDPTEEIEMAVTEPNPIDIGGSKGTK